MASTSSTAHTEPAKAPRSRGRRYLFGIGAFLIITGLIGWQVWALQNSSTDPKVAGHPLSNPQMHLHTLALGGKPGIVYLGTHYGLFTSTDGGRSWPQSRGVLNTLMITVISVNPTHPSYLAVIGIPSVSTTTQGGLYFSRDGGQHWNLHTPANLPDTSFPFTVQAGTGGAEHFYAFYLYAGWFETRDMGQHWRPITNTSLSDMQNPALLTFPGEPDQLLLGGDKGLFESNDDGQHWNHLASVNGTVQKLLLTQNRPRRIFCLSDQGLYAWTEGSSVQTPIPQTGTQAFSRLVSDQSGTFLYGLAGRILWLSQDGGQHWQKRQQFDRGDLIALQVDPQHPERLYAAFFQPPRVLISQNSGTSWQLVTG